MGSIVTLVIVAVIVMAVANALLDGAKRSPRGRGGARIGRKPLMTDSEQIFWHVLRHAAAPLHVAPQVSMGALLRAVGGDQSANTATRNQYDRKIVDFVLFDDDGFVHLLVELDDPTHRVERDSARDARTDAAGYTTLRIRNREARSVAMLAGRLAAAVPGVGFAAAPPVAPALLVNDR